MIASLARSHLNSSMRDEPRTFLAKFNAFFTRRRLLLIIGFFLGMLLSWLLGLQGTVEPSS